MGGLISGPPQRGAGTQESPSGWLIVLETWTPPSDISSPASDIDGAAGDVSEGDPADASRNGRVDRQMVWGGCVGLVLKGRVRMEPLIAQVNYSQQRSLVHTAYRKTFCPNLTSMCFVHGIIRVSTADLLTRMVPQAKYMLVKGFAGHYEKVHVELILYLPACMHAWILYQALVFMDNRVDFKFQYIFPCKRRVADR